MPRFLILLLGLTLLAGAARAEEGMWLPDAFPADRVAADYGFRPDAAWLDHARLAAVRLDGCSGGLVSATGLVATNHHCVEDCLAQNSTKQADLSGPGFYAATAGDEKRCAGAVADRLLEITHVTDRILEATKGKEGAAFAAAFKAETAAITSACRGGDDKLHCQVVTLFAGGRYDLYKYRRYQDVRLVFAPENDIANFGGDPDNFEFPRYALDVAFLRLYEDGKPLDSKGFYFHLAEREALAGDLVFTVGDPGRTARFDTVAQLEAIRDVELPQHLLYIAEERGLLRDFTRRGPDQRRIAEAELLEVENTLKLLKGEWAALIDPALITARRHAEAELRGKVAADPSVSAAWDDIARAVAWHRTISARAFLIGQGSGASDLLADALVLVRAPVERAKPDGERLGEYSEARFPSLREELSSDAPIVPELETLKLAYWLRKLQEDLGPDDTDVRALLASRSPDELAANLVKGSRLGEATLRRKLLDGGAKVVDAARDPMLDFARLLDPIARAVRTRIENEYDSVLRDAGGRIGRAAFGVYGDRLYPDATFTLRLSWGTVKGWTEPGGRSVPAETRFAGLFGRATGNDPFRLPPRWAEAKAELDPGTQFDFATTNDIVGGNSGSPVIDRKGEVLGLAFDGNIQSLGGDYGYDPTLNRSVVVSAVAIREALAKLYGANRLLDELGTAPR
ncbi:MAG TPA: S46 family peptidase [Aliidongia sp.]|nr:S46 family peptidase [Aliidongia sp.]